MKKLASLLTINGLVPTYGLDPSRLQNLVWKRPTITSFNSFMVEIYGHRDVTVVTSLKRGLFFCSTSLWYKHQQQREIAWSASQAGWTELVKVVVLILFNQLVMLITRLCVAVVVLHHKLVEQVILIGFFFWSSHFIGVH